MSRASYLPLLLCLSCGASLVTPRRVGIKMLAAGSSHTCALLDNGEVWCWGGAGAGQLGDRGLEARCSEVCPELACSPNPIRIDAPSLRSITAFGTRTCGITDHNRVVCWGSPNRLESFERLPGECQFPADRDSPTNHEVQVVAALGEVSRVFLGAQALCGMAVLGSHELRCVGDLRPADACSDERSANSLAEAIQREDSRVRQLALGSQFSCWTTFENELRCIGQNYAWSLTGGEQRCFGADRVLTVPGRWRSVSVLDGGVCGVTTDGSLLCWGSANKHLLEPSPMTMWEGQYQSATISGVRSVSALRTDNRIAWGIDGRTTIGLPDGSSRDTGPALHWAAGEAHICFTEPNRTAIHCWGSNNASQLGLPLTVANRGHRNLRTVRVPQ